MVKIAKRLLQFPKSYKHSPNFSGHGAAPVPRGQRQNGFALKLLKKIDGGLILLGIHIYINWYYKTNFGMQKWLCRKNTHITVGDNLCKHDQKWIYIIYKVY